MAVLRLSLVLLPLLVACGGKDQRGSGGGRNNDDEGGGGSGGGRDESQVGDGRDGGTTSGYTCYDAGYADCYYHFEPDASWWDCGGNADENDYWDGYCDCEYDFGDTYYCGSSYYTTY